MAKSLSQQKKEIRSHIGAIKQAAIRIDLPTPVFTLYEDKLKKVNSSKDLASWYYAFSKRINAMISQDHREATLMRNSLNSMRSIIGLDR